MARRHRTRRAGRRRQNRRTARQRKQQGGAEAIANIRDWVAAVKGIRSKFVKQPDSPEQPEYTFGDLASEDLTLPPQTVRRMGTSNIEMTESNGNFDLSEFPYEPKDIRAIGTVLMNAIFTPFAQSIQTETGPKQLPDCNVDEFKQFIEIATSPAYVENNSDSLAFLSAVEFTLQKAAGEASGNAFSVSTNDERVYPLYSWYLVMNLPKEGGGGGSESEEEVPVLIEAKEVAAPAVEEAAATESA